MIIKTKEKTFKLFWRYPQETIDDFYFVHTNQCYQNGLSKTSTLKAVNKKTTRDTHLILQNLEVEGEKVETIARCHHNDTFVKEIGRQVTLEKLQHLVDTDLYKIIQKTYEKRRKYN